MKKFLADMRVLSVNTLGDLYVLMKLSPADGTPLPEIRPGQFVQVEVPHSKTTFLRRPISVNFVDYETNSLWLLIRKAGAGTRQLSSMKAGDILNIVYPLGNGFTVPSDKTKKTLLVGGGVGVAPLLYWGKYLRNNGFDFQFLLGARSANDILQLEEFEKYGAVNISTEDGSLGEKGLVTAHSSLTPEIAHISCCGPVPMMKAVARVAREIGATCEVSLENMMACGVGACLCCVEKTVKGNVCVCTEGPVFDINMLTWQI